MYRRILVDDQEGVYTILIQMKKWYGWTTIKSMCSDDLHYLNNCAVELLEKLNEEI